MAVMSVRTVRIGSSSLLLGEQYEEVVDAESDMVFLRLL